MENTAYYLTAMVPLCFIYLFISSISDLISGIYNLATSFSAIADTHLGSSRWPRAADETTESHLTSLEPKQQA